MVEPRGTVTETRGGKAATDKPEKVRTIPTTKRGWAIDLIRGHLHVLQDFADWATAHRPAVEVRVLADHLEAVYLFADEVCTIAGRPHPQGGDAVVVSPRSTFPLLASNLRSCMEACARLVYLSIDPQLDGNDQEREFRLLVAELHSRIKTVHIGEHLGLDVPEQEAKELAEALREWKEEIKDAVVRHPHYQTSCDKARQKKIEVCHDKLDSVPEDHGAILERIGFTDYKLLLILTSQAVHSTPLSMQLRDSVDSVQRASGDPDMIARAMLEYCGHLLRKVVKRLAKVYPNIHDEWVTAESVRRPTRSISGG